MRASGSGAGASARARHRTLAAEHRTERAIVRVVVAVSAGALVAGLSGSYAVWAGPAGAMGALVAVTVYERSRPTPVNQWRRGARTERRTGRRLSRLDTGSYLVLHDRALPDLPSTNLDHLVIGRTGVYAIVSRRWAWRSRLAGDGRRVSADDRPLSVLSAAAGRAARSVSAALSAELGMPVRVVPVVAVHGARMPVRGLRHGRVAYQPVRRLSAHLGARPAALGGTQVSAIAAAAERLFPPMTDACMGRSYRYQVTHK